MAARSSSAHPSWSELHAVVLACGPVPAPRVLATPRTARSVASSGNAVGVPFVGAPRESDNNEEANMAGMVRKLIASGVAAKLVQEARKPQNQAKIKQMIADFQN